MQITKSVKNDANKVAVSSIKPRKDTFNSNDTHLQNICSTNNLPLL